MRCCSWKQSLSVVMSTRGVLHEHVEKASQAVSELARSQQLQGSVGIEGLCKRTVVSGPGLRFHAELMLQWFDVSPGVICPSLLSQVGTVSFLCFPSPGWVLVSIAHSMAQGSMSPMRLWRTWALFHCIAANHRSMRLGY